MATTGPDGGIGPGRNKGKTEKDPRIKQREQTPGLPGVNPPPQPAVQPAPSRPTSPDKPSKSNTKPSSKPNSNPAVSPNTAPSDPFSAIGEKRIWWTTFDGKRVPINREDKPKVNLKSGERFETARIPYIYANGDRTIGSMTNTDSLTLGSMMNGNRNSTGQSENTVTSYKLPQSGYTSNPQTGKPKATPKVDQVPKGSIRDTGEYDPWFDNLIKKSVTDAVHPPQRPQTDPRIEQAMGNRRVWQQAMAYNDTDFLHAPESIEKYPLQQRIIRESKDGIIYAPSYVEEKYRPVWEAIKAEQNRVLEEKLKEDYQRFEDRYFETKDGIRVIPTEEEIYQKEFAEEVERYVDDYYDKERIKNVYFSPTTTFVTKDHIYTTITPEQDKQYGFLEASLEEEIQKRRNDEWREMFNPDYRTLDKSAPKMQDARTQRQYLEMTLKQVQAARKLNYEYMPDDIKALYEDYQDGKINTEYQYALDYIQAQPNGKQIMDAIHNAAADVVGALNKIKVEVDKDGVITVFDNTDETNTDSDYFKFTTPREYDDGYCYKLRFDVPPPKKEDNIIYDIAKQLEGKEISEGTIKAFENLSASGKALDATVKGLDIVGYTLDIYDLITVVQSDRADDGEMGKDSFKAVVSTLSSWAGGKVGEAIGIKTGAAIGALGGPVGVVIGAAVGSFIGSALMESAMEKVGTYLGEELYE